MLDTFLPVDAKSPEDTRALGKKLGKQLEGGTIIALFGDLGAGKTQLVKGICEGLGLDPDTVTSPTFTLINEYRGGRLDVYHFDAYRIRKLSEFISLDYEDYFFGNGVTVIEWADRIEDLLPPDAARIRMTHVGPESRRIEWYEAMQLS